jgi:hypothetical protein
MMPRSPTPPRPRPLAGLLAAATLVAVLVTALGGAASAADTTDPECTAVVDELRSALAKLPNKDAQPGSAAQTARQEQAIALFADAGQQHPGCEAEIEALGLELQAAARRQGVAKGTPFWGPVGFMWNNVYYRVFNANNVMMALFGWALLLSPFILVLAAYSVLRGSKGAFHRPFVPEHLRTDS